MTEANRQVREDLVEVTDGRVLVSTSCWSCGAGIWKAVLARQRNHQHFSWSCDACDVAWTGPGSDLHRSA
ncbi:hypothetical protein [Kribbella monticola]|uniref:hypothetical protein n=1 Tax=Kribbella monticola TaxID=2185285 RepID=UPI000DD30C3D|nr:hypothetical protein [Kribbella monticola]